MKGGRSEGRKAMRRREDERRSGLRRRRRRRWGRTSEERKRRMIEGCEWLKIMEVKQQEAWEGERKKG